MFVIIKVCGNVAFIVKFWPDVCSTCFLGLNRTRITEMSPRFIFKRCFFVLFSSRSGDPPPCSRNPWWPYFCHIFSELVIIVVFCKVPLGSLYLINCESVSRVTCFLIFWVFITLSHPVYWPWVSTCLFLFLLFVISKLHSSAAPALHRELASRVQKIRLFFFSAKAGCAPTWRRSSPPPLSPSFRSLWRHLSPQPAEDHTACFHVPPAVASWGGQPRRSGSCFRPSASLSGPEALLQPSLRRTAAWTASDR